MEIVVLAGSFAMMLAGVDQTNPRIAKALVVGGMCGMCAAPMPLIHAYASRADAPLFYVLPVALFVTGLLVMFYLRPR